jgi:hypothetical protein
MTAPVRNRCMLRALAAVLNVQFLDTQTEARSVLPLAKSQENADQDGLFCCVYDFGDTRGVDLAEVGGWITPCQISLALRPFYPGRCETMYDLTQPWNGQPVSLACQPICFERPFPKDDMVLELALNARC